MEHHNFENVGNNIKCDLIFDILLLFVKKFHASYVSNWFKLWIVCWKIALNLIILLTWPSHFIHWVTDSLNHFLLEVIFFTESFSWLRHIYHQVIFLTSSYLSPSHFLDFVIFITKSFSWLCHIYHGVIFLTSSYLSPSHFLDFVIFITKSFSWLRHFWLFKFDFHNWYNHKFRVMKLEIWIFLSQNFISKYRFINSLWPYNALP